MKTAVKSSPPTARLTFARVDRRLAILLFALSLGVYTRTLAPGLLFGDPGEFHFAAWRFGLAHPTGYPLYLLLGGAWQHLAALFGADPAFSLNLFSALLAATTVALFYLAVLAWLPQRDTPARIAAVFAALLVAVNPTFWSQALIAEVYALHALFIAAFLLLTALHAQSPIHPISQSPLPFFPSPLFPLSLLLGFALSHHRTALFLLPGYLLWLLWRQNQNADSTDFADFRRFLSALIRPIPSTGRRVEPVETSGHRRAIRILPLSQWAAVIAGLALPQILYLYIPLRSGADASPWLYPQLGGERLALYTPTLRGFIDYITGSVFAVSFFGPAQAAARILEAANLWLAHFTWPGLALALLGLVLLVRGAMQRDDSNADSAEDADFTDEIRVSFNPCIQATSLLLLTLPAFGLLQIFNLFYGIGDIYVFYIPLYLIAGLWAAWGVAWLVGRRRTADDGRQTTDDGRRTTDAARSPQHAARSTQHAARSTQHAARSTQHAARSTQHAARSTQYAFWLLLLLTLPLSLFLTHLPAIDQSRNTAARGMWDAILAAQPPDDAILVSNDRNEIVPLYYLQAVEGKAVGLTGLFPLLTPEERFADVAAVTATALAGERPVYFIKAMAGLEARFDLEEATPPLIRVVGVVGEGEVERRLDLDYGPLTLLGYGVGQQGESPTISLYWRVEERLAGDFTSSVQLFTATGQWLAQDDRPPGGVFYPTSLWKPGEVLRDTHLFPPGSTDGVGRMHVLFYTRAPQAAADGAPEFVHLAPVLEIGLP